MYIIDGYNLLKLLHKTSYECLNLSPIELCRIISKALNFKKQQGLVIFDGINPDREANYNLILGLEIFYAGPGKDADSLIEKKIESDSAPKRLIIVSNDRRIRNAAKRAGATSIKSDDFWLDIQKNLKRKRRNYEPSEKHRGLDDGQTALWLKEFGIE